MRRSTPKDRWSVQKCKVFARRFGASSSTTSRRRRAVALLSAATRIGAHRELRTNPDRRLRDSCANRATRDFHKRFNAPPITSCSTSGAETRAPHSGTCPCRGALLTQLGVRVSRRSIYSSNSCYRTPEQGRIHGVKCTGIFWLASRRYQPIRQDCG
jgi:hypothetical protein